MDTRPPEMPKSTAGKKAHRSAERYQCPPFFAARITGREATEERATIEDLSLRGLCARTSCEFEQGSTVEIELISSYVAPVKVYARVKWTSPPECEGASHLVGFAIQRVRIVDWFRFMKLIAQLKREVW